MLNDKHKYDEHKKLLILHQNLFTYSPFVEYSTKPTFSLIKFLAIY